MEGNELKGLPIGCGGREVSRLEDLLKLFFLYWLGFVSSGAVAIPGNFDKLQR